MGYSRTGGEFGSEQRTRMDVKTSSASSLRWSKCPQTAYYDNVLDRDRKPVKSLYMRQITKRTSPLDATKNGNVPVQKCI